MLILTLTTQPYKSKQAIEIIHVIYSSSKSFVNVISFIVGTLQSFLEPERVRSLLEEKRTFAGNILAAMVLFGLKVTLIYIGFGVGLAIASGYIIGLMKLEKWVEPFVWELQKSRQGIPLEGEDNLETVTLTWGQRFEQGRFQSSEIVRSVWLYVVIGIAIGAGIHGYVPTDFIIVQRSQYYNQRIAIVQPSAGERYLSMVMAGKL